MTSTISAKSEKSLPRDARSSEMLRGVQSRIQKRSLTFQDGTDRLSRNVGKELRYTLRDTPDKRRSHLLCGRSPKSQIVPWCSFLGRSAPAARRCRSKGPDLAPRTWLVRHSPSLYWRCGNMHRKEMRVWLWLWWQFPLICLRPWIWRNTLGDSRLESVGGAWRCQFLRYYGYRYHINKISVCTIGGLIMTGEKTKYLEKKISMVPRF